MFQGYSAELSGLNARMIFCKVGTIRGLAAEELVKSLPEGCGGGVPRKFPRMRWNPRRTHGRILSGGGSLFLVGEAAGGAAERGVSGECADSLAPNEDHQILVISG